MNKVLLLDLEGTVIDVWSDNGFMSFNNTEIVRKFIREGKFDRVGLFSFAVWNDIDLNTFHVHLKQELEELFEFKFTTSLLFTVEDFKREFQKLTGTVFDDVGEFISTFKKDLTFFKFLQTSRFKNCDVTLLDDMVPDLTLTFTDRVGRMVNVVNLENNYGQE